MHDERLWLLISLKLSEEATSEELADLNAYLQLHPEKSSQLEILTNIWKSRHQGLQARKEAAFNKHLQRLSNHLSEAVLKYESEDKTDTTFPLVEAPKKNRKYWLWIAGGIAASTIPILLFFQQKETKTKTTAPVSQNTVSTNQGSKSKIQLPDGTQVWLNADSRLTYDENFKGPIREVHLTGEAYFDVAKDKEHPFIIHTQAIDLKVLGTAFNVRSYANERQTEASLIHGSIEITLHNNPDKKIILKPNEKLVVQNNQFVTKENKTIAAKEEDAPMMVLSRIHFQKKDTIASEILWVKNKLAFDNETLENVALKIERWYDVTVTITDEKLKQTAYSGVFEDESLQQVMEALRLTGNFSYTINKKEVIIKP
jgi:ferric-dicitrate binding protein FerR (iron transport regulator)